MKRDIFQYCDSVIHIRNRRYRIFQELIDNYWVFREKNYGTLLFITSDLDKTYDTLHKTIVTYMMNMDIMNIRKNNTEIVMGCLIGNQEKIMIIIKKDYNLDTSVRGMRADQIILVCEDEIIKVDKDIISQYLLSTVAHTNNGKDLDRLILIY